MAASALACGQASQRGIRHLPTGDLPIDELPALTRVFTNDGDWRAFWLKYGADAPPADFDAEAVVLASLGAKPSGGYRISIEAIRRRRNRTDIVLSAKPPDPREAQITVIAHAVVLAAIPAERHGRYQVVWK